MRFLNSILPSFKGENNLLIFFTRVSFLRSKFSESQGVNSRQAVASSEDKDFVFHGRLLKIPPREVALLFQFSVVTVFVQGVAKNKNFSNRGDQKFMLGWGERISQKFFLIPFVPLQCVSHTQNTSDPTPNDPIRLLTTEASKPNNQ